MIEHLAEVEPLLRATATAEIDATAPLSEVVARLAGLPGVLPPRGGVCTSELRP